MARTPGLPTRQQILDLIASSDQPADKREIARAFGVRGAERAELKRLLTDMADEGLIDLGPGRAFHRAGGVPRVTVLRVVEADQQPVGVPESWDAEAGPPPRIRILERGRRGALGIGDRLLARTEERGSGIVAHPMKTLAGGSEQLLGVIEEGDNGRLWLRSTDKRARFDTAVSDAGEAKPGQLVLAEATGRGARTTARVTQVLGDPFAPRAFSLIAIHKYGIPNVFPPEVEGEAERVAALDLHADAREDLRHLPILAIDPADARDHDDAIWAESDGQGGWHAIVAIADVSFYVRPGSALDREARKRGNSVYFPDRVVPMLPHALSSDMCSLKAGEDRAALACHLAVAEDGRVTSWRFTRAVVRLAANIAYEDAQGAADARASGGTGPLPPELIAPLGGLWDCWRALERARSERAPLELDLPERVVKIDEKGRSAEISLRERLDAHRLVEDFMIAANVAAARALETKKSPLVYRVHEPPTREKLVALKDYLKTHEIGFALGQVIRPATFNTLLDRIGEHEALAQIQEQILRSQTQAYYSPANAGHFGLALGSYAHFTSPIRRYADLIVHRALVSAYRLELPPPQDRSVPKTTGLGEREAADLERIAEAISKAERRAMEAERETLDRYVAAYLSERTGEILPARITGVQPFGFFATVEGLGGDGLVPVSTLGAEHFRYDEAAQALEGQGSGTRYVPGQRLPLRLVEANPVSGALRFELPEGASGGRGGGGQRSPARRDGRRPDRTSGGSGRERGRSTGGARPPGRRR